MVNGVPTIVSRRKRWMERRPDDVFHVVKFGEELDEIAFRLYGSGELWWIIAEANAIADPFEPLEPGTVLRCPSVQTVFEEVLA